MSSSLAPNPHPAPHSSASHVPPLPLSSSNFTSLSQWWLEAVETKTTPTKVHQKSGDAALCCPPWAHTPTLVCTHTQRGCITNVWGITLKDKCALEWSRSCCSVHHILLAHTCTQGAFSLDYINPVPILQKDFKEVPNNRRTNCSFISCSQAGLSMHQVLVCHPTKIRTLWEEKKEAKKKKRNGMRARRRKKNENIYFSCDN